ncbi:uncharacterized protein K441DRAFT_573750, partial [Cenococcum geophilum 1.58]|uniref:uncharacterized protein n=1 Tax=Cenococcum geophilum 1.58 TaxID=794803 RepID=UPI00358E73BC
LHLSLLTVFARLALTDVEFTSPAAGALLVGGGTISIMWQDSCIAPLILDLSQYQLFLVAGG